MSVTPRARSLAAWSGAQWRPAHRPTTRAPDSSAPFAPPVDVRRRLAAFDMLAAAKNQRLERVAQAQMVEMGPNPARRAGRGDGARQTGGQRADEIHRAGHRRQPIALGPRILFLARGMKGVAYRATGPTFDRVDEIAARQAHEMRQRIFGACRVAGAGQELGDLRVTGIFAFQQHAVEIEDHASDRQPRAPNNAVPTRT